MASPCATQRVLFCRELVENVLIHCSTFDICTATQVCSFWREVIESSIPLRNCFSKYEQYVALDSSKGFLGEPATIIRLQQDHDGRWHHSDFQPSICKLCREYKKFIRAVMQRQGRREDVHNFILAAMGSIGGSPVAVHCMGAPSKMTLPLVLVWALVWAIVYAVYARLLTLYGAAIDDEITIMEVWLMIPKSPLRHIMVLDDPRNRNEVFGKKGTSEDMSIVRRSASDVDQQKDQDVILASTRGRGWHFETAWQCGKMSLTAWNGSYHGSEVAVGPSQKTAN